MKYTTIAVLSLQAGVVLGLTDAQAAPRMHALAPVPDRKAWYTTTAPVQFKVGEVLLCDGDLPKHLAHGVESADSEKRKAGHSKAKTRAAAAQAPEQAPVPDVAIATTVDKG